MTEPSDPTPSEPSPPESAPPAPSAPEPAGPAGGDSATGPARTSGDEAIAAADVRADSTRGKNLSDVPPLPIPADTANLRQGPELHPDCLPLLPLVGVWRGEGSFGNEPGGPDTAPDFGQQISITHDGRPFLRFESVIWLLGADGPTPGPREVGWLRPQPDGSIELLLAHAEGRLEVFYGQQRSPASWALTTDGVLRTPTAVPVVGATRLYGVTADGRLAYVEERAHTDAELAPHASALLERLVG